MKRHAKSVGGDKYVQAVDSLENYREEYQNVFKGLIKEGNVEEGLTFLNSVPKLDNKPADNKPLNANAIKTSNNVEGGSPVVMSAAKSLEEVRENEHAASELLENLNRQQ